MKQVTIGIDIGGTNTKFGLVDKDGRILASHSIRTPRDQSINDYVEELSRSLHGLIDLSQEELQLMGMGIGAPNGNYYEGTIEDAPNLIWDGVIPFVDLMKEKFDVHTVITNDANAAAIGEMVYGGAKEMKDFIVITLGTGIGSGFIVNGELVYGADGFAGEFGHVITVWDGRPCTCGRRGCIETYASARGVVLTVMAELAGSKRDSGLRNLHYQEITPKKIFEAAEAGDPIAQRAFERTGNMLGRALSNLVNIFSPEAIFLFGGVARAGHWIIDPTKNAMENNVLPIFRNKVQIIPSHLPASDAAILGASALAWKELEKLKK
ncbi:MAG: ROK family protein [Bacteroidia bacterium]|nr:ROK family protein [Bacteroidia bacterium]